MYFRPLGETISTENSSGSAFAVVLELRFNDSLCGDGARVVELRLGFFRFGVFAMRYTPFLLLVLLIPSCDSSSPTTAPPKAPHVYDVGWTVLVRDFETANSYTGQRVRIRLDRGDYRIEAGEVRVYAADNGAPAILVLQGIDTIPLKSRPAVIVTGTCRGPVRDGLWRNRSADYCVTLTDCTAVLR